MVSSQNTSHNMQLTTAISSLKALQYFSWQKTSKIIILSAPTDISLAKCEGKLSNLQMHALVKK